MSKVKTEYICSDCGGSSPKWAGMCPFCKSWNTLTESIVEKNPRNRQIALAPSSTLTDLADLSIEETPRFDSGLPEFDRVLGGGFVKGGVILIGGDPGIGKSTLLLQSLAKMSVERPVLYVSGEESTSQIALRAKRLDLGHVEMKVMSEVNLAIILSTLDKERPDVAVIDSIQTVYSDELSSAPGSVAQVRECAAQLTRLAKTTGITLVLVGHVTKEGNLAGPRVLEHIVDSVLYFEGDSQSSFRMIRAFKNRFGAVNELGVFAMTDKGLKGVSNPSAIFLSTHNHQIPGSAILVTQEGTRPILVEVQALVDTSHSPNAKRLSLGLDANRLAMLLAVIHRHAQIACHDQDVFINAVGGVKITEPAADLAVALAIASSLRNKALPKGLVVFGEIGLAGEVRPAPRGLERLKEAGKLGFTHAIVPKANLPRSSKEGGDHTKQQTLNQMKVYGVDRIDEVFAIIRDLD